MCLAIPMKIISIDGKKGIVEAGNVNYEVNLQLIEDPKINDYVIIHAGFAISKIRDDEAVETLKIFEEFAESENA